MLNEETREMIDVTARFVKNEIAEGALDADLSRNTGWLFKIWEKGLDVGYHGLVIPEEYGGAGQSDLCAGLVLETFASGCAAVASLYAGHFAACRCISLAADEAKRKYLESILQSAGASDGIATIILPSDFDDNRLTATRGDGGISVSGTSGLTCGAGAAQYFCVFCNDNKSDNIICFIAERGRKGIMIGEDPLLPGLKANPFTPVIFDNYEVPAGDIISAKEPALLNDICEIFHGYIAAISTGTSRSAYDRARAFAEERYQFGKMIINHSEIQRMLGAMKMKLSVGKSAYMDALSGDNTSPDSGKNRSRYAKIFCADSAVEIAIDAIQIHGGYGYTHDYGVEKIMRDAKVLQMLDGTSPELCVKAIAEEIK